jgi:uncharacterized protein YbaR (Trm112 family)
MDKVASEVKELDVADELRVCPECEYQRGFHVSFRKQEARTNVLSLVLICPGCGGRFDIKKSI